ncbi:hypothetical protein MtrunA17_Chr8g0354161 [Medicago truncatula]|uniref:Uncharacterized protein n=1 Tax=Medicago truncatula TaxID=3880 RepID=A0A396GIJ6_MEDTR|nr:hypothetical protein MtrunA17_Chr8g0354161 [Medicago truncatula]
MISSEIRHLKCSRSCSAAIAVFLAKRNLNLIFEFECHHRSRLLVP